MRLIILIIFVALQAMNMSPLYSQNKQVRSLEIGDTVKNVPSFKNLVNYPAKELNLTDLRGKLVILDFWSTGCPTCIESIPHLERLQAQFKEKLKIIMINPWETKEQIDKRVSKMKILRPGIGLTTLPNVYGDTIWRRIFPHVGLPHHVWIDQNGKVIATTHIANSTPEHVQQALDGKDLRLSIKKDLRVRGYNVREAGFLKPGDTAIKPLFYSAFFKHNFGFGAGNKILIDSTNNLYKKLMFNLPVLEMFRVAFQIPFVEHQRVLLEVSNPASYYIPKDNNQKDKWFSENSFCYELSMPLAQKDSLYSYMIQDFNRFFSVQKMITGSIEQRKYPCYVLKKINNKILVQTANSGQDTVIETSSTYNQRNRRYDGIRWYLKDHIENLSKSIAFKDETGIKDDTMVSLDLPKDFTNKTIVNKMLRKQGLELVLEERRIPVLVIKDLVQSGTNRKAPL